eukprot:jgi/Ulvmu1/7350/UM036_0010.1
MRFFAAHTRLRCEQCAVARSQTYTSASSGAAITNGSRKAVAKAVGRSPSSIAEAFFQSSTSSTRDGAVDQNAPDGSVNYGPDAVVSFLSDDIVAAAFEHARNLRTPEEAIDVNLDLCLQAAHTRCPVPVNPGDPEQPPPFLDTYSERALKYAGVAEHRLVSSVSISPTTHVARYIVVMDTGEQACLTFQLAWESVVRAAYRGIATENAWALKRVRGESVALLDKPHESMGPEGSLRQHMAALAAGDIPASFKFMAACVHGGEGSLQSYREQLESPLFRPLLSHISASVVSSRHASPCRMSSIVKIVPDPRRAHLHSSQCESHSSDALFYFTLTSHTDSGEHPVVNRGWFITEIKVVPVQFVNAWPRSW